MIYFMCKDDYYVGYQYCEDEAKPYCDICGKQFTKDDIIPDHSPRIINGFFWWFNQMLRELTDDLSINDLFKLALG